MEIDGNTLNGLFQALTVGILALIAWYNQQRTASAATTAAATTSTATTNAAIARKEDAPTTPLIIVTGPWTSNDKPNESVDGTRVIVDENTGAFQVIDDRIAPNFIEESVGANAAQSGKFRFTGNLSLVTHGKLL
jgi:hypothetical protein